MGITRTLLATIAANTATFRIFLTTTFLTLVAVQYAVADDGSLRSIDFEEYRSCGANALYVVAKMKGIDTTFKHVSSTLGQDREGRSSLKQLDDCARELGLHPVPVKLNMEQLNEIPVPSILHVQFTGGRPESHYVVFLGSTSTGDPIVLDPPLSPMVMEKSRFGLIWTRNALVLYPSHSEEQKFRKSIVTKVWLNYFHYFVLFVLILCGLYVLLSSARNRQRRLPRDVFSESKTFN